MLQYGLTVRTAVQEHEHRKKQKKKLTGMFFKMAISRITQVTRGEQSQHPSDVTEGH